MASEKEVVNQSNSATQIIPGEASYKEGLKFFQQAQYRKGLSSFSKAAEEQYPAAYIWLSYLYNQDDLNLSKNEQESEKWAAKVKENIHWFEDRVETRDPDAHNNLGWCYYYGIGVNQDLSKAVEYFNFATSHAHFDAQNNLGLCYDRGQWVEQNFEKAVRYYRLAANQGYVLAQNNLDILLKNNPQLSLDTKTAYGEGTNVQSPKTLIANSGPIHLSKKRLPQSTSSMSSNKMRLNSAKRPKSIEITKDHAILPKKIESINLESSSISPLLETTVDNKKTNTIKSSSVSKKSSSKIGIIREKYNQITPEMMEENIKIGRLSEEYIFNTLQSIYRDKYRENLESNETTHGFTLFGAKKVEGNLKYKHIEVIWLNKNEETGSDHDLEIIKKDKNEDHEKKYFIEVKGTKKSARREFPISAGEVNLMKNKGKFYRIYRVFNIYDEANRRYEVLKEDPKKDNQIDIKTISLTATSYNLKYKIGIYKDAICDSIRITDDIRKIDEEETVDNSNTNSVIIDEKIKIEKEKSLHEFSLTEQVQRPNLKVKYTERGQPQKSIISLPPLKEKLIEIPPLNQKREKNHSTIVEHKTIQVVASKEFKKAIDDLVGNKFVTKKFAFRVYKSIDSSSYKWRIEFRRGNSLKMTSKEIDQNLNKLREALQEDLRQHGLADDSTVKVNLRELIIYAKDINTLNQIGTLIKDAGKTYWNPSWQLDIFFFKSAKEEKSELSQNNPELEEISTINCSQQ